MNNRINYIDITKGITIILVALSHSQLTSYWPGMIDLMSLFRLPLFFLISGVFFSYLADPKSFFLKKSEALLKPYLSTLLIILLIDFFFVKEHMLYKFIGVLYGNGHTVELKWMPLWFLTHLFAVYSFSYIIFRYVGFSRFPVIIIWLIIFLFLIIGSINIQYFWNFNIIVDESSPPFPGLPFSVDIILITSSFFIAGYLLKQKIINFSPNYTFIVITFLLFLLVALFTEAYIDLNDRVFTEPHFSIIGAVCGIYLILCFSFYVQSFPTLKKILIILGSSSLYILLFHNIIGFQVYHFFKENLFLRHGDFINALLSFIISILFPIVIKWFIDHNHYIALFFKPLNSNNLIKSKKT